MNNLAGVQSKMLSRETRTIMSNLSNFRSGNIQDFDYSYFMNEFKP